MCFWRTISFGGVPFPPLGVYKGQWNTKVFISVSTSPEEIVRPRRRWYAPREDGTQNTLHGVLTLNEVLPSAVDRDKGTSVSGNIKAFW